jgi:ABC-2 type transport system permease protein
MEDNPIRSAVRVFKQYASLTYHITKTSVFAAMEFRASFLTQIVGMVVNDIGLIMLWLIFFAKFPVVKGWTLDDTKLIFAVTTVNFAIVFILARGAFDLSRAIHQGELDYFLSYPKSVLWHLSVSKTEVSAIGDLIFGIVIFFVFAHPTPMRTLLFAIYTTLSAGIMYNFIVITQTLAFFFRNIEEATQDMFHALLGFTFYPQTVFSGGLKVVMMTILPAYFIAGVPVAMVREFNWTVTFEAVGFWLLTLVIAIVFFNYGMKKYESGNLISV